MLLERTCQLLGAKRCLPWGCHCSHQRARRAAGPSFERRRLRNHWRLLRSRSDAGRSTTDIARSQYYHTGLKRSWSLISKELDETINYYWSFNIVSTFNDTPISPQGQRAVLLLSLSPYHAHAELMTSLLSFCFCFRNHSIDVFL